MKHILLAFSLLLLSTDVTTHVIPNKRNDLITLPLIKRTSALRKRQANDENYKLYNEDRVEYLTKIYIGTPPQEFYVSIDTGR